MKTTKNLLLIAIIVLISNFANAQFTHWDHYTGHYFNRICESPVTNEVFADDGMNIYKYNENVNDWDSIFSISGQASLTNILFDANGTAFLLCQDYMSYNYFLYKYNGAGFDTSSIALNTAGNVLFFDAYNNLWITDMNGGLQHNSSAQQGTFTTDSTLVGLIISFSNDIVADNEGNIWFYNSGGAKSNNSLSDSTIYKYDIANQTITDSINVINVNSNLDPYSISIKVANNTLYISGYDTQNSENVLYKYDGNIHNISLPNDNNLDLTNLVIVNNNSAWIRNYDSTLYYIDFSDTLNNLSFTHSPQNDSWSYTNNLFYGQGRYLFLTTDNGSFRIDLASYFNVYVKYNSLSLSDTDVVLKVFSNTLNSVSGPDSVLGAMQYDSGANGFVASIYSQDSIYLKANLQSSSSYNNILLSSYYSLSDTTYLWDDATVIDLSSGANYNLYLNMYEIPVTTSGVGAASGNISYGSAYTKASGEPVPGAEIIIEQEPNDDPVAMSVSDSNGDYSIGNLSDTIHFRMTVDVPGIPQIQTYTLNYSPGNCNFTDLNFYVDTIGIYTDTTVNVQNIKTNNFDLSIYPIPSNNSYVNIDYNVLNDNSSVNYRIVDLKGSVIYESRLQNQNKGEYHIRTNDLNKGVYFIQFNVNNDYVSKKIIITE